MKQAIPARRVVPWDQYPVNPGGGEKTPSTPVTLSLLDNNNIRHRADAGELPALGILPTEVGRVERLSFPSRQPVVHRIGEVRILPDLQIRAGESRRGTLPRCTHIDTYTYTDTYMHAYTHEYIHT